MSSEDKSGPVPDDSEAKAESKPNKSKEEKPEGGEEVDDDRGEDQLVIDEPEEKSDGESDEKEFEPTIDMMMNDFDDEQTMEEEEANEDQDNEEDELAALEQEQDMPIEELLKMYGAVPSSQDGDQTPAEDTSKAENKEEEIEDQSNDASTSKPKETSTPIVGNREESEANTEENGGEVSSGEKRRSSSSPPPVKKSRSELARFYEAAVEGRALRSQGSGQAEEVEEEYEEEGEDEDQENRDYSWKKTIMIGPSFQASVPLDLAEYGDTLPYGRFLFLFDKSSPVSLGIFL